MDHRILGLHHVTAIAGDARQNRDFYTRVLGMRLVKKTVSLEEPGTYHLFYGDRTGSPGALLTFFPLGEGAPRGRRGLHQTTEIGVAVPAGSLDFWRRRLETAGIILASAARKFGTEYLTFLDPDGLKIELTVPEAPAAVDAWATPGIAAEQAIRGLHHVTVTTERMDAIASVLTDLFGYRLVSTEVNRHRFGLDTPAIGRFIDLVEVPGETESTPGRGTVQQVALRVADETVLQHYRQQALELGLRITETIDRLYFAAVELWLPGGIRFVIATDRPGVTVDEPVDRLGNGLMLPAIYEPFRNDVEQELPRLDG